MKITNQQVHDISNIQELEVGMELDGFTSYNVESDTTDSN